MIANPLASSYYHCRKCFYMPLSSKATGNVMNNNYIKKKNDRYEKNLNTALANQDCENILHDCEAWRDGDLALKNNDELISEYEERQEANSAQAAANCEKSSAHKRSNSIVINSTFVMIPTLSTLATTHSAMITALLTLVATDHIITTNRKYRQCIYRRQENRAEVSHYSSFENNAFSLVHSSTYGDRTESDSWAVNNKLPTVPIPLKTKDSGRAIKEIDPSIVYIDVFGRKYKKVHAAKTAVNCKKNNAYRRSHSIACAISSLLDVLNLINFIYFANLFRNNRTQENSEITGRDSSLANRSPPPSYASLYGDETNRNSSLANRSLLPAYASLYGDETVRDSEVVNPRSSPMFTSSINVENSRLATKENVSSSVCSATSEHKECQEAASYKESSAHKCSDDIVENAVCKILPLLIAHNRKRAIAFGEILRIHDRRRGNMAETRHGTSFASRACEVDRNKDLSAKNNDELTSGHKERQEVHSTQATINCKESNVHEYIGNPAAKYASYAILLAAIASDGDYMRHRQCIYNRRQGYAGIRHDSSAVNPQPSSSYISQIGIDLRPISIENSDYATEESSPSSVCLDVYVDAGLSRSEDSDHEAERDSAIGGRWRRPH